MSGSTADIAEPQGAELVTAAFAVGLTGHAAPASIRSRLAELEVTRREGTIPLVVTRDEIMCMYLVDFLAMPVAGQGEVRGCRSTR